LEAWLVSPAPRLTSEMLTAALVVPVAASPTLREMSLVTAPCSCAAAAIAPAISEMRPMVPTMSLMARAESRVALHALDLCSDLAGRLGGLRGERLDLGGYDREAAARRAALIVAFRKLVCSATAVVSGHEKGAAGGLSAAPRAGEPYASSIRIDNARCETGTCSTVLVSQISYRKLDISDSWLLCPVERSARFLSGFPRTDQRWGIPASRGHSSLWINFSRPCACGFPPCSAGRPAGCCPLFDFAARRKASGLALETMQGGPGSHRRAACRTKPPTRFGSRP
jgi:hypothetical protein